MYFTNILNEELNSLPKPFISNFSIKLSDVLHKTSGVFDNKLFKVEEIVTDKFYRVYPLFNCKTITSTNPLDKVFENRLIICNKTDKETFLTFQSNDEGVKDYQNYTSYYSIGDSLTVNQFNALVDLLRNSSSISESLRISDELYSSYGNYLFEWSNVIILDNGFKINETSSLSCTLIDPVFHYSTYNLQLKIQRIIDTDLEGDNDNIEIIPITVALSHTGVTEIPLSSFTERDDVILFDAELTILHNIPIIPDIPKNIFLSSDKNVIQVGEKSDLQALVTDIGNVPVGEGHIVKFYDKYYPVVTFKASPQVIQSGDTSTWTVGLKDGYDGSLVSLEGCTVKIYEVYTPDLELSANPSVIQSGDTSTVSIKLKDSLDGSIISLKDKEIRLYEEYTPASISLTADKQIIQTGEKSDLQAKLKSSNGSLIVGEDVYFYMETNIMFEDDCSANRSDEYTVIDVQERGTGTISYDSTNQRYNISNSSSGTKIFKFLENLPVNCKIKIDLNSGDNNIGIGLMDNSDNTTACCFNVYHTSSGGWKYVNGEWTNWYTGNTFTETDWVSVILVKEGLNVSLTYKDSNNNVLDTDNRVLEEYSNYDLGISIGNTRNAYFKNITVFDLTNEEE